MKRIFTLLLSTSLFPLLGIAQNVGVDVAAPVQKLDVAGGIRIGNTATGVAGSIRWNGTNIQYHNGTSWVSLVANSDNQTLSLAANILSIQDGNTVDLSAYMDDTDNQTLSLATDILSIQDGNTVDLSAYMDNTDAQALTLSGTNLTITGGNTVTLSEFERQLIDTDSDTKIQVEEGGADEDVIRFDVAGNERWVMRGSRLENSGTGRSVFVGQNAGTNDDLANRDNTAVGENALSINSTGINNVAVGNGALNLATSNSNTAAGKSALGSLLTGSNNTALGSTAAGGVTTGQQNVMIGAGAGLSVVGGSENTILGDRAGQNAGAASSGNVFLGHEAGFSETGSNKLYIDNSNAANPLIYGDFDDNILQVNGTLNVNGAYDLPFADGAASGYVMTTDAAGNATWSNPALTGDITAVNAGDGLINGGTTGDVTLDLNPDNSTVEVDSDILRVKAEGITANEIATDGVESDEIAANAVGLSEIATGGVASDEIVNNSIEAIDINSGAVTTDEILDGTILPIDVNVGGTANQILAVDPTGTSVVWTDAGAISNQLTDLDADTKIEVENSPDEDQIRMTTNGNERLTIDNSGKVGIGTNTPDRNLHVTDATGGVIMVTRNDAGTTSGETLGEIQFDSEDNTDPSAVEASALIRGIASEAHGNSNKGGHLAFATKSGGGASGGSAASERMRITNTGNVGIGTNSPDYKLDVNGDIGTNKFLVHNGDDNTKIGFTPDRIQMYAGSGSNTWIDIQYSASEIGVNEGGLQRDFRVETDNDAYGLMVDGSSNNVGIGAQTPTQKLHVGGGARITSLGAGIVLSNASGVLSSATNLVGSGLGDNLGNHSATTTLQMGNREVNQVTYLDITAGNDYGIRFWDGSDSYKIQMGNDQQNYGWVTDYSIHSNMNNQSNRGWTWGYSDANVQTSLSTEGHFRTRGVVYAENYVRSNNAYYSDGNVVIDDNGGWHRSYGNTGWYNGTHGGGIYMTDNTWVRTYGSKNFYCDQEIRAESLVRSPSFIDLNDGYYFLDPNSWSRTTGDFYISHNNGQAKVGHGNGNGYYCCGTNWWGNCNCSAYTRDLSVYGGAESYAWYGWSDGRYKKNISTVTGALDMVKAMRGVYYDWEGDYMEYDDMVKSKTGVDYTAGAGEVEAGRRASRIGVVAQELEEVLPMVVAHFDDKDSSGKVIGNHLAVNYDDLIPVLIEAMKEQQTQIEELQAMVMGSSPNGASPVEAADRDKQEIKQALEDLNSIRNMLNDSELSEMKQFMKEIKASSKLSTEQKQILKSVRVRFSL